MYSLAEEVITPRKPKEHTPTQVQCYLTNRYIPSRESNIPTFPQMHGTEKATTALLELQDEVDELRKQGHDFATHRTVITRNWEFRYEREDEFGMYFHALATVK